MYRDDAGGIHPVRSTTPGHGNQRAVGAGASSPRPYNLDPQTGVCHRVRDISRIIFGRLLSLDQRAEIGLLDLVL